MNTAIGPWMLFIVVIVAAIVVCYSDNNHLANKATAVKTDVRSATDPQARKAAVSAVRQKLANLWRVQAEHRRRRGLWGRASDGKTQYWLNVQTFHEAGSETHNDLCVQAVHENGLTWDSAVPLPHNVGGRESFLRNGCTQFSFRAKPLSIVRKLRVTNYGNDGWGAGGVEVYAEGNEHKYQCAHYCYRPHGDDCLIDYGETKELSCSRGSIVQVPSIVDPGPTPCPTR